eukprot:5724238-Pyramimonas_sp.AAC.1
MVTATRAFRWSSLWGHETLYCGADAGSQDHWGLRRSALRGRETLYWAALTQVSRPLGPSVELLMGPRNAVLGGAYTCGHS